MTGHRTRHDPSSIEELLAERFRADAPREAPSWLLPAVQDRVGETAQGGSGRGSVIARVLAVAAVLVLAVGAALVAPGLLDQRVGVVPSASPEPSAGPSSPATAEPSPSAQASEEPRTDPSAAPSDPALPSGGPDEIVLEVTSMCDVVPPVVMPVVVVAADGRVVWNSRTPDTSEYRTRRLSGSGLEELRDRLTSTGLFDEDRRYEVESLPDVEPPGMGGCLNTFTYRADGPGDQVVVESGAWYGDELESEYFVPSPERRTLNELLTALGDPEPFLGEDAWATASEPFVPDRYLVVAGPTVMAVATLGAPDVDEVTWPFDATPDAFGDALPNQVGDRRCGIADSDRVRVLVDELVAAGLEQFEGTFTGAGAVLPWASRDAGLDMSLWPVIADGAPACDDVS